MDDRLMDLISEKPIIVPKIFLKNYRKLNISSDEFIVILTIMDMGNKVIYDPISIANELNMDKMMVMEIINNLVEKNILLIISEKNNRKTLEYISLELLYEKIINIIKDVSDIDVVVFTKKSCYNIGKGRSISRPENNKEDSWYEEDSRSGSGYGAAVRQRCRSGGRHALYLLPELRRSALHHSAVRREDRHQGYRRVPGHRRLHEAHRQRSGAGVLHVRSHVRRLPGQLCGQ